MFKNASCLKFKAHPNFENTVGGYTKLTLFSRSAQKEIAFCRVHKFYMYKVDFNCSSFNLMSNFPLFITKFANFVKKNALILQIFANRSEYLCLLSLVVGLVG